MPNNSNRKENNLGSWILPIIFLFTPLMPIGIIMLIVKALSWVKQNSVIERTTQFTHEDSDGRRSGSYTAQNVTFTEAREGIRDIIQTAKESRRSGADSVQRGAQGGVDDAVRRAQNMQRDMDVDAQTVLNSARKQSEPTHVRRDETASERRASYLEKKYRRLMNGRTAFTVFGIIFLVPSFVLSCVAVGQLLSFQNFHLAVGILSVVFAFVSSVFFALRTLIPRKIIRYRRYSAIIGNHNIIEIRDVAYAMGVSEHRALRDLQDMIDTGYFSASAYIDYKLLAFVADSSAAPNRSAGTETEQKNTNEAANLSGSPTVDEYERILRALRKLNDEINDAAISVKIDRIESVSSKIFSAVRENPQKLPNIRRMMNYYLPTTLKLLESYAKFERQGISGDNIDDTKSNIDRVLGTIAAGFERQLDQLYLNDVIDISADINVLENMMARDGLSGSSAFGSAAAALEQLENED